MREILLRAKRKDNNKWLVSRSIDQWDDGRVFLFNDTSGDMEEVIPETVGQFTGLCDKTGKRIFEGDIVRFAGFRVEKDKPSVGYVYWNNWRLNFGVTSDPTKWNCDLCKADETEIIGNIHDNPELPEVKV